MFILFKLGLLPVNDSNGVTRVLGLKHLFLIYADIFTAYVQKIFGKPDSCMRHLAISNNERQFLSAVPFWCGEYGAENSCLILFFIIRDLNSEQVYSVPLSVLKRLTHPYGEESDKNFSAAVTASFLFLRKYTAIAPE